MSRAARAVGLVIAFKRCMPSATTDKDVRRTNVSSVQLGVVVVVVTERAAQELGRLVMSVLDWLGGETAVTDDVAVQKRCVWRERVACVDGARQRSALRLRLESLWAFPWLERVANLFGEVRGAPPCAQPSCAGV